MVYRCELTRPHVLHRVMAKKLEKCSGNTPCGISFHDPHDIEVDSWEWCEGICGCRMGDEPHSYGDHK